MDLNDHQFDGFHKTLDARMKDLTSRGIGVQKKQSDPITQQDEETLWDCGELGTSSSQSLLNTVFYYNCKIFGLRGMDEHRKLECDQFSLDSDSEGSYIEFLGRSSKNFNGGVKQRKIEAKSLKHYSDPCNDRSLYDIYKLYLDLVGNDGPFYKRSLGGPGDKLQAVGVNKLSTIIKTMAEKAGMKGKYTNNSGKQSCATTLFQNGVDEQLIMGRTGHRSNAVRAYKRPSQTQQRHVSELLDPPKKSLKWNRKKPV